MTTQWQEENAHAQRVLDEPCHFCRKRTVELWYDPALEYKMTPYQVRCSLCGARGPECDCGEEAAVFNWLRMKCVDPGICN